MSDAPKVTVFTGTYNRVGRLHRGYESLRNQTFRDFEWRIVDDGSTDGTDDLISQWKQEAPFPINYHWKENGGYHTTLNLGYATAIGEYFIALNSDDALLPDALENLIKVWNELPADKVNSYSSVVGLCENQHGNLIGSRYPVDPLDSDPWDIRFRWNVTGDKIALHRTEVVRQFPYPEDLGGSYYPEDLISYQMGQRFRSRYVNVVALKIFVEQGSITRTDPSRYARQNHAISKYETERAASSLRFTPKRVIRSAANYVRFGRHLGKSVPTALRELSTGSGRALAILAAPLGMALYRRDLRRFPKP